MIKNPEGKPRKISSPKRMEELWEEYKEYCDIGPVIEVHEFSAKNSEFCTETRHHPISYTIEGFCVWIEIARSAFYATYASDVKYQDIVSRMKQECEADVRHKFEVGIIPTQLAALWMSKFGYSAKQDTTSKTESHVKVSGKVKVDKVDLSGMTDEELSKLDDLTGKIAVE
jgi:hypothetical protein